MALSDDLVAYYNFDETSGTSVNDEVGSNDGAISAGVSINQSESILGRAFLFAGDSTSPELVFSKSAISSGSFSIQIWFRWATGGDGASQRLIQEAGATANLNISLEYPDVGVGGGGGSWWASSFVPSVNTWYHLVYVMDTAGTDTERLYVNGSQVDTNNVTRIFDGTSFELGSESSNNRNYAGYMDEFAFWGKALSSSEVSELYNSGDGLAYPFATNITLTPAALTLSTTQKEPIIKVLVSPLIVNVGVELLSPDLDASALPSHLVVGTGGIGTRFINTDWPIEEGLQAGTQKQKGRIRNLIPMMSNVTQNDSVGIDN
jgi:hypothetical protein